MKFNISKFMMGLLLIIAFFAILLLSSCEPGVGPKLTSECDYSTPRSVTVIEYDTQAEMNAAWEFYTHEKLSESLNVSGFATHNRTLQIHTLHVLKIRGQNDHDRIETIGHELMHSFCGEWHPIVR